MKDLATNRSRGFGFINFADSSSVERVLTSGPHTVDSKVVEAKVGFPRPKLGNSQLKECMMEYRSAQSRRRWSRGPERFSLVAFHRQRRKRIWLSFLGVLAR